MKQLLAAFTLSQLQTFRNILSALHNSNKTIEEALVFIEGITKLQTKAVKLCPQCKNLMRLFAVNISKATQVGGEFKSQWQCVNCEHDIFSKNTPHEEILKTRRLQNGTR